MQHDYGREEQVRQGEADHLTDYCRDDGASEGAGEWDGDPTYHCHQQGEVCFVQRREACLCWHNYTNANTNAEKKA